MVEIGDAYAVAQIASHLQGHEAEGIEQILRVEDLAGDLISAGYLPANLATGSLVISQEAYTSGTPTTQGIPHTGQWYSAIGKGLLKLSAGTFNWIAKNRGLVLGGAVIASAAYVGHSYLSQPLEMKRIQVKSADEQLRTYVENAGQGAIDAALAKTATVYAEAGQSGFAAYAKWLVPMGLIGGGIWFYFYMTRSREV